LERQGISARLDAAELGPGSNFAAFMDSSLAMSDYCFLLWSASARASPYVTEEWQTAWTRGIAEKRAFLVVGRLEELPVPALLRNRVWVNLFPTLEVGLQRIVTEWQADRKAAIDSGRQVGSAVPSDDAIGVRIYISSELYGFTHPAVADLQAPAGVLLDRTLQSLGLVKELRDASGRIGLALEYQLQLNGKVLSSQQDLGSQGVQQNTVLQLLVSARVSAATLPASGSAAPIQFLNMPKAPSAKPPAPKSGSIKSSTPAQQLIALNADQRRRLLELSPAFGKPRH